MYLLMLVWEMWVEEVMVEQHSYSLSPPLLELSVILSEMRVLTAAKSDGISGKYGPPNLPQQDSKQVVNT